MYDNCHNKGQNCKNNCDCDSYSYFVQYDHTFWSKSDKCVLLLLYLSYASPCMALYLVLTALAHVCLENIGAEL